MIIQAENKAKIVNTRRSLSKKSASDILAFFFISVEIKNILYRLLRYRKKNYKLLATDLDGTLF